MKKLVKYLKPYKLLLVIGPLFKLAEAILELLLPFLMSKIIDVGVANQDREYVLKMGGVMLITAVVGVGCALVCQYSASLVAQGVGTDIRNDLFHHITTLSSAELDGFGTSSLVNRITNDVNQVQLGVAMLIRLVIRAPFLAVGGFVMAMIIDVKLSMILLTIIPIFVIILVITMMRTVPLYRTVQTKLDKIALVLRENMSGVRVIRAFSKTEYENERFDHPNKEYEKNAIKVGRISALLNPLTSLVMNVGIVTIIWFGGVRVQEGSTSTGEIIAFIGYVGLILSALIIVSHLVVIYTKAFASAGRIAQVFETKASIVSPDFMKEKETSVYAVEFKQVSMTYEEDSEYDIQAIDFKVKKGETIGIIGGTGSGKSTIINLIPRFYDVNKGSVLVDGRDVREYQVEELREKISVVPQKTTLLSGTIKENIRWGNENATDEEVKLAAEIAQAAEFIERLPEGYDTRIQSGGVNVSGGQRQRLTIARALVRKPEILILDDSFNALDFVTDAALRRALYQSTRNMTTFIVSQRASTIQGADQIIILEDGVMVGLGKHEQLLKQCQVYREIYESQRQEKEGGVA